MSQLPHYVIMGRFFEPDYMPDEELSGEEAIMGRFEELANELSPENLSCDGELPASRVRARARELRARWAVLERNLGRPVSEDEIWKRAYKRAGF